jgi:PAS domain S-box-containing protein/putative nucleotidyltransferase with HDIG domain
LSANAKVKTKEQLIGENVKLRQRVAELERLAIENSSPQESLRRQRKEFQIIFDSVPTSIWYTDREGRVVGANRAAASTLGLSVEDMIGKFLPEVFPAEEASRLAADLKKIIDSGIPKIGVIEEHTSPSGERRIVHSDEIPYLGDAPDIMGMIVVKRDITKQRETEDRFRETEEMFRLFMEHNPTYVFFKDENSRLLRLSRNYEKLLNLPLDQAIGKTMDEIFPSDLAKSMIQDDLRVLREQKPVEVEETLGDRHYRTTKFPIIRGGKPPLLAGFTVDITKQKQNEKALKESVTRLRRLMGHTIDVIARAVELKDPYTSGHQKRVSNLARAIATEMGLLSEVVDCVRLTGSIHDLGKIAIPSEILSMPRKLTRIELSLIKTHAEKGREILQGIEFPWPIADIVVQHHERLDGSGYPRHLKGNKILLESRIIAVADVVEAIASHRPYRPALGMDVALEEIEKYRGVLYDPDAVDACLRLLREKGFSL